MNFSKDSQREIPGTKTITIRLRVRCIEFDVLVDCLAGELEKSALKNHGCLKAKATSVKINGKEVRI